MADAPLSDDTRYCKLVLLVKKCGNLVCKKYILKCVPPDKTCIDECLKDNENKLRTSKHISDLQISILFPSNSSPTDLDQWDVSLHSYILLNLFCCELTADNITAIKALREERNNLCHSPSTIISEILFLGKWAHLSNVIFQLTKCLTTKDQEEIKGTENQILQIQFHVEAVEQLELVERYEDDEGKVSGKIKSLEKRQDEIEKRLIKLEALESRVLQLEARLKVEAPNHEAAEAAQTSLYNAAKRCVSNGLEESSNDDDDDVSNTMKNLSSDMKEKGVDIDKVERGSIIFSLRCNSITALKNIYIYFYDKQYKGRLTELENTLSERLLCSVKLNFSIILETLYTALTQIEKATYSKSVVLTLKCRGAEGVRNAYKCLVNGSSTNAVNNVSEALSKSVRQKIELHASIDTDKLERDLNYLIGKDKPPPIINTKVKDQIVSLGKPWELNVPVSGDGPFIVKVMKGGTELTEKDGIEISSTADCVTLKVNKLIMEDSGSYRIDVSNDIGTDSCTFEMKVVGIRDIILTIYEDGRMSMSPLFEDIETSARVFQLADYKKFTEYLLQNKSTLHSVCIEGYCCQPSISELPVISLHHLTSLSLSYVNMQHNRLHNLVTFLSDNISFESITLSDVSCVDHRLDDRDCTLTLNLPQHTKLTLLCLKNVNILCNNAYNFSLLYIILYPLSERIARLCYSDLLNCIRYSQLEHLYIFDYYMLDYNTMKTLTSSLESLPCLKALELWYMVLPDDVLLQLHSHVTQVKIKLQYVTMSCQCFHCFIDRCVNTKSEIKVELCSCKITSVDGEIHSELSEEESVKYMSEYLESMSTINITFEDHNELHFETTSCQ